MEQLSAIRELLDADRCEDALRLCEEQIQASGGRGEVALLTAHALAGLARLQEAETWVQRARSDLGDDEEALRLLARIYRRRGWRVRAQAIERRLAPQASPARSQLTFAPPTASAEEAAPPPPPEPAPAGASRVAPTADAPTRASYAASPSSSLPKLVSTSGTDIPSLERRESVSPDPATVESETRVEPGPPAPDPLGLLSVEEAEVARSLGAVRAVVPDPASPPQDPEPTPSVGDPPTLEPRDPFPTARLGPASLTDDENEEVAHVFVDDYSAQRRRSKVVLVLGTLLTITVAMAAVVVYRAWREETRQRTLLTTQRLVDTVEYEGLTEARELVREAIGGSTQPDGTLCARGSQVELYLWMYYTGERAYLHQARELLDTAIERDPGGVETRFAQALWEGYLGDVSVTLSAVEGLDSAGLRTDRLHLLRGVAASSTGDHAQAAHHFEEAVSLWPSALNHLAFARAAERQGALVDAQDQLEGILANDPGHILAEVDLALIRAGAPTRHGYDADVEKIQEEYNGRVPARVMSRVFAARALGYAARNDNRRTEQWFGRALDQDPENPDILLAYGHELRIRGDLSEARAQLSKIVKNQPYSGDALGELGIIAYLQDRPHFLADRLASFPDGTHRGAAYQLASGLHHLMNGEPDLAAQLLSRTPEDLWGGEAHLHLGRAQLEAGDTEAARQTLEGARRSIKQHRGKSDPLVSAADLALALVDVREKGRASSGTVDRCLNAHSRYPIVLFLAAQVLEESGSERRASSLYRKAFERGQDFSLALVGFVRTSRGDSRAEPLARVAADTYLRITPRGPNAGLMKEVGAP